ncbi:MAG: hypothetical protein IKG32_08900 [Clostridia bacterium]|nr:hypothetical protein [Clostridia bacterium]
MENSRGKQNGSLWPLWLGLGVLGGVSAYYYPLFVLTMLVVPAIWAAMAFRVHPVTLLAAGTLMFLFGYFIGFDTVNCLCILGLVAPAGCLLWLSQKERMGNFQSVLFLSVALTFGLFLIFCMPDLLQSGDPYASIRTYFADMPELFAGTVLYDTARLLLSRIDELIVACFFAFAGVYALVNVLVLHAFNRRQGDMPLCPLGPFGTWRVPYGYAMALGAASLVSTFATLSADSPTMSGLSLLLYEMWAMPLMVTGANFLYSLLGRRLSGHRLKLIFGVMVGALLVFAPYFAQMVLLLLGFSWIIFRRRARKEGR